MNIKTILAALILLLLVSFPVTINTKTFAAEDEGSSSSNEESGSSDNDEGSSPSEESNGNEDNGDSGDSGDSQKEHFKEQLPDETETPQDTGDSEYITGDKPITDISKTPILPQTEPTTEETKDIPQTEPMTEDKPVTDLPKDLDPKDYVPVKETDDENWKNKEWCKTHNDKSCGNDEWHCKNSNDKWCGNDGNDCKHNWNKGKCGGNDWNDWKHKHWCWWHHCGHDHHERHNHNNDRHHYDHEKNIYYYYYTNSYSKNHGTVILQPDYSHTSNYHQIRIVIGDDNAFDTVVDFAGKPESLVISNLDLDEGEHFDVCLENEKNNKDNCVTATLHDEDKPVYVDIRVP